MHWYCRSARRFLARHRAFYTGAFRKPLATGTVFHAASWLRSGMLGSWAIARVALLCSSQFLITRRPGGDGTDNRLSTSVNMDMLDYDALLTLAAPTIEGFAQSSESPREFACLVQGFAPTMEVLPVNCGTPVALHRGVMDRDQLRAEHSFECVSRLHRGHRGERRAELVIRSGAVRRLGNDNLMNEICREILVIGAGERAGNVRPLCEPRVFDQLTGLLGPRRRSFLLSFASSLRARSRI